jgi:DNA-directed RNA polymerase specialized sigma subunit
METMLERYKAILSERQVDRSEALFVDRLKRFRSGEELAGREISGSYLQPVMELVESLSTLPQGLSMIDAIEAANVGLVDAIQSFEGSSADEFWQHVKSTIMAWLHTIDELQGMADGQENPH